MKYIFFLFFLIFVSCVTGKKTYVCGDHPCLDKKEFKEYFAENLILEIETKKSKKYSSVDLVKLNNITQDKKINNETTIKQNLKMRKKEKKILLKNEKIKLKKERKIKAIQEKKMAIQNKKLTKLKNNKNNKKNKISDLASSISKKKKPVITSKEKVFNGIVSENSKNVCSQIKDCDIDKITELLIKKGKEKDFPNINLK